MKALKLLISRGAEKVPVTVPPYERPVIEALFGAANVKTVGTGPELGKFDAEAAHSALTRKYSGDAKAVLALYPNPAALADAVTRATPKAEKPDGDEPKAAK